MTALTAFYDLVLPELPRCEETFALSSIRQACEEFYRRSRIKRVILADIATVNGTAEYALTFPTGYVATATTAVYIDGERLQPIGMDDLDALNPDWKSDTGEPTCHYLPNPSNIGLFLTPNGIYTVSVEAILKPKSDATSIDDWVYEQYRDVISAGAKKLLMEMPKKPWSDSTLASYYHSMFENGIHKAGYAANRGYGRAEKRVRPVFGVR